MLPNCKGLEAELFRKLVSGDQSKAQRYIFFAEREGAREIATALAGAIEPELLKFERNRIAERPELNEDAYVLYQRGLWHHYRGGKADNKEAQRLFRAALAISPDYPQAMTVLAIAVTNAGYIGWADDVERSYTEAYELAQRAVALDRRYPDAHFALGLVCMWTRRFDRAMAEFQEAIKLNPSFAAAHALLGYLYLLTGQPEEAIVVAEKGIRLDPRNPRQSMRLSALAGAHYRLRHYEQAVDGLGTQPELAGRSALCGRRARSARSDRGGRDRACRAKGARSGPRPRPRPLDALLSEPRGC